jgi:hypothetical protein
LVAEFMITSPQEAARQSGIVRSANRQRRDSAILVLRAQGRTVQQIADRLKVTTRAVYMSLRRAGQDAQTLIAEEIQRESITPELILTRLSEMFNADYIDIIEPALSTCLKCEDAEPDELPVCDQCNGTRFVANPRAGSYRPIEDWPPIWRKMLSGAEVKELFEHSRDGAGASWDKIGELVKIKFVDPLKLTELLMKHKGVDAMVQPAQSQKVEVDATLTVRWADPEPPQKVIDVTPGKK